MLSMLLTMLSTITINAVDQTTLTQIDSITGKVVSATGSSGVRPKKVVFGNDVFLTSNNYQLYYSIDGRHWADVNLPMITSSITDVNFANGKFIISTVSNGLLVSSDAKNWTTSGTSNATDITYGGGRYLGWSNGRLSYSSNLTSWTTISSPSIPGLQKIIFEDNKFWILDRSALYVSNNGTSVSMAYDFTGTGTDISYVKGKFFLVKDWSGIVDGDGGVYTSTDGTNWTACTALSTPSYTRNSASFSAMGFVHENGKYLAIKDESGSLYIRESEDGIDWSASKDTELTNMGAKISNLCTGNGLYILTTSVNAGENGFKVYVSPNKIDWDQVISMTGTWLSKSVNGRTFLLWSSSDASNNPQDVYEFNNTGGNKYLGKLPPSAKPDIQYADGYYYVSDVLNKKLYRSLNMKDWDLYTTNTDLGITVLKSYTVGPGAVLIGDSQDVLVSQDDNSTWQRIAKVVSAGSDTVAMRYFNNKYFIFFSNSDATYCKTSDDGLTWGAAQSVGSMRMTTLTAMDYINGTYAAMFDINRKFISSDGVTWTQTTDAKYNFSHELAGNKYISRLGDTATISMLTSDPYLNYEKSKIAAVDAVEIAEATTKQIDIDTARALVEALNDPEKSVLNDRLDAIVVGSHGVPGELLSQAVAAVELAENTLKQTDVDAARIIVNQVFEPDRSDLNTRLDAVQALIDATYPGKYIEALAAVEKAEYSELQSDIDAAYILVVQLKEPYKEALTERLDLLVYNLYQMKLQAAENAVIQAENTKLQADVTLARNLVSLLKEPTKTELNSRLDLIQTEIDLAYPVKLNDANTAVIKAELTKSQSDVDAARILISDLKEPDKLALGSRLDAVQSYINAMYSIQLDNAISAVVKAETNRAQVDVETAKLLVNELHEIDKNPLLDRLAVIQLEIDIQYQELLNDAADAVVKAETDRTQADVDAARAIINQLKDSDKGALSSRLDIVQAEINAAAGYAIQLSKAISAVEKAQSSNLQIDVDTARVLVDILKDEDKAGLNNRLDAVQTIIDNLYQQQLSAATDAVIKAESSKLQQDLDAAKSLVNVLKESDKSTLISRLNDLQNEINTANYQVKVNLATQAVVNAENSLKQSDVEYARVLINALNDPEKTTLNQRLDNVQQSINNNYAARVHEATLAVEKAESTKNAYDILAAKNLVMKLNDPEKTELSNRLDLIVPVSLQQIIPIVNTFKLVYSLNDPLDLTGAKIQLIYDNGSTNTINATQDMVLGFTTSSVGNKTMNILYQGKSSFVNYTVQEQTSPVTITVTYDDSTYSSNKVISVSTTGNVNYIELPTGAKIYKNNLLYTVTANGNYAFSAISKDGVSADSDIVTITKIDTQAPILSFQWPQSNFSSVTMSAIDLGSGVDRVITPDGVEHLEVPFGYSLSGGTGTVTCYDYAGNVATKDLTVNNIYIGVTGNPTFVALSGIPQEWTNKDIDVTAAAYNPVDGVNSIVFMNSSESFNSARLRQNAVASTGYTPLIASGLFSSDFRTNDYQFLKRMIALSTSPVFENTLIGSNGEYKYTVNNSHGLYTNSFTINNIDKVNPEIIANVIHNSSNGESAITYTITDNLSGIKSIILPDGQEINIPSDKQLSFSGNLNMLASGNFDILVKDYAGNVTIKTITLNSDVDDTPIPPVNPPSSGGGNGTGGSGSGDGSSSGNNTPVTNSPTTNSNTSNKEPVIVIREDILLPKEVNGYITGYSKFKFAPNDNITRGQLATMLYKITGGTVKYKDTQYKDVSKHWAKPGINFAIDKGLMTGIDSKNFYPNKIMTRKEVAIVIYKFLDIEKSQTISQKEFADTNGIEGEKEINYISSLNIINGSSGKFRPQDYITRAEIVVIINNILGERLVTKDKAQFKDIIGHWGEGAINKAYCK